MFFHLTFSSRLTFYTALAICEASLRPEADLCGLSDLPEGEDVVKDVVEKVAFNEPNNNDVSEDVPCQLGFDFIH